MGFSAGGFAATSGYRVVRRLLAQDMPVSNWIALKRLESLKASPIVDSSVPAKKVQMLISRKNYEAIRYAIELQSQLNNAMEKDMKESATVEQLIPKAADYMAIMYAIEYGGAGIGVALQPGLLKAATHALSRIGGYEIGIAAAEASLTLRVGRAKIISQRLLAHSHGVSSASAASSSGGD